MADSKSDEWKSTACVLCSLNCGVKVQIAEDGKTIARTKGDEDHPASAGYLCNKASRLNFYQNRADRLRALALEARRAGLAQLARELEVVGTELIEEAVQDQQARIARAQEAGRVAPFPSKCRATRPRWGAKRVIDADLRTHGT